MAVVCGGGVFVVFVWWCFYDCVVVFSFFVAVVCGGGVFMIVWWCFRFSWRWFVAVVFLWWCF